MHVESGDGLCRSVPVWEKLENDGRRGVMEMAASFAGHQKGCGGVAGGEIVDSKDGVKECWRRWAAGRGLSQIVGSAGCKTSWRVSALMPPGRHRWSMGGLQLAPSAVSRCWHSLFRIYTP